MNYTAITARFSDRIRRPCRELKEKTVTKRECKSIKNPNACDDDKELRETARNWMPSCIYFKNLIPGSLEN